MTQKQTEDTSDSNIHIKAVMQRYQQAENAAFAIAAVTDRSDAIVKLTQKLGRMTQPDTAQSRETDAGGNNPRHQQADRLQEQILESNDALNEALERQKTALQAAGGIGRIAQLHHQSCQVARELTEVLTVNQEQRTGKPCIRGMRITVYDVLEHLDAGVSEEEILADFAELTGDDIRVCRVFADTLALRLEKLGSP